jgi:uncharacterized coiled-coil DUF342 family protein
VSESQDLREFIREQSLIAHRRADEVTQELREYREAMHRHFDEQARKLDDVLAENRMQRDSLFQILDQLRNGGTASA